jgi:hypothetical protein
MRIAESACPLRRNWQTVDLPGDEHVFNDGSNAI